MIREDGKSFYLQAVNRNVSKTQKQPGCLEMYNVQLKKTWLCNRFFYFNGNPAPNSSNIMF